ncbi:MAG TPA: zinc ribbon domain-containing protein [Nitrososphaeraceae archaeon]
MSASEEPPYIKWLRENYPTEFFLFNEITKQVNKVYARSQIETNSDSIPIDLFQMRKPDGYTQLGARDSAFAFYGVFAKTLIDIISKNLKADIEPKFLENLQEQARKAIKEYTQENFPIPPSFKRCSKCDYDNDSKHQYCGKCGNKL